MPAGTANWGGGISPRHVDWQFEGGILSRRLMWNVHFVAGFARTELYSGALLHSDLTLREPLWPIPVPPHDVSSPVHAIAAGLHQNKVESRFPTGWRLSQGLENRSVYPEDKIKAMIENEYSEQLVNLTKTLTRTCWDPNLTTGSCYQVIAKNGSFTI